MHNTERTYAYGNNFITMRNVPFAVLPVYDQGSYSEKSTVYNNNMNMLLDVTVLVSAPEMKQKLEDSRL